MAGVGIIVVFLDLRDDFLRSLLFFSFQATSSDFRLVTAVSKSVLLTEPVKQYALCVNDYALLASDGKNGIIVAPAGGCPDWAHAKPAAVVNIEHPVFEGLGFITLLAGFLLQYLSVPSPKTIAQIRKELKTAKAKEQGSS